MTTAEEPRTLAIDVGGTGLKASVLTSDGDMVVERVRKPTTYPCPPHKLVSSLSQLVSSLPAYDRVSVGFPGMVRRGEILSAPHFVTSRGPGSPIKPALQAAWERFDLAGALAAALGKPTKVVNDADLQGAGVVRGHGLELVITLGTGLGTAVFHDGALTPHLELAHHPFRKSQSYNEQVGDAARKRIGPAKWNRRVKAAIGALDGLLMYDHLFIGGGNARRLTLHIDTRTTIVDNIAGILGGIRLWDGHVT